MLLAAIGSMLTCLHCHDTQRTIVVERAYHGHTNEVIAISPYKYKAGREDVPGSSKPDWVTEVSAPDTYRGEFTEEDAGQRFVSRGSC